MYSGNQWLLIDIANQYGLDKELFDVRLDFGRNEVLPLVKRADSLLKLKDLAKNLISEADEPEMFCASLIAIWDAYNGEASGYMVGLDSVNSGPQLLSLLTKCKVGMANTGSLDTGVRPDMYSLIDSHMIHPVGRSRIKKAVVPYVYGSEAAPERVMGEMVNEFKEAYKATVPGAEWAKNTLINSWNSNTLHHSWKMPNGQDVHINVIGTKETVGKIMGHSFTYTHSINTTRTAGEQGTKANSANVTHSWDAFILNELDVRCNYDRQKVLKAIEDIELHFVLSSTKTNEKLLEISRLAERHEFLSVRAMEFIEPNGMKGIPEKFLWELLAKLKLLLEYPSFEVREIHDEFACLPNHVSHMRKVYNDLLAETYLSSWLFNIIEDLTGKTYHKWLTVDTGLVPHIKENTYALC